MKRVLLVAVSVGIPALIAALGGYRLGRDAAVPAVDVKEISVEEAMTLASNGRLTSSRNHRGRSDLIATDGRNLFVRVPGGDDGQSFLNHLNRAGVALSAETRMTTRTRVGLWLAILVGLPSASVLLFRRWLGPGRPGGGSDRTRAALSPAN